MTASVYKLVFQDPNMKKLAPISLEIGTYTTDTVKIVGSCVFYLVHPDTKILVEVTFFVAMNDWSILLSCKTTLMLGLIQSRTRFDYLPQRASLITSSAVHPKKTKSTLYPKAGGVNPNSYTRIGCSNAKTHNCSSQADNKQRSDSARIPWCLWRDWQLPRTIVAYTDWSRCYTKANTLPPNPCSPHRSNETRNRSDVASRSAYTSSWSYTLDKHLCVCWEQGIIRLFEAMHLLGPNQSKQGDYKRAYYFRTPDVIAILPIYLQMPASWLYAIVKMDTGIKRLMKLHHSWPPLILRLADSDTLSCHLV